MRKTLVGLVLGASLLFPSVGRADEVISIFNKVCATIEYTDDIPEDDHWQTPEETEKRGKGDCEDMAFYLHSLLIKNGYKADVAFGKGQLGNKMMHAWVETEINGKEYILDATGGFMVRRDSINGTWYVKLFGQKTTKAKLDEFVKRSGIDYVISHYYTDESFEEVFDGEENKLSSDEPEIKPETVKEHEEVIVNPFVHDKESE